MKYDVKYFDADDGKQLDFQFGQLKLNILKFKYLKNQLVDENRLNTAFDLFKHDVNTYVNRHEERDAMKAENGYRVRDFDRGRVAFDVFTILPYLYLTAEAGEPFQYPICESLYQEEWLKDNGFGLKHTPMLSGNGRSLILGRYFPDQMVDILHSDVSYGIGDESDIDNLLDEMLSNSYWKGKSIDEYDIVINLCCVCTNDFFEGIEDYYDEYTYRMVYTVKSIELVDKCYLKTRRHYRPERFVEKTATVQNWLHIRNLIERRSYLQDQDYWDLLDDIISDRGIYMSTYDWKI